MIVITLLRPSTLSFSGYNKYRQANVRGFSAGLEGRASWTTKDELEVVLVYCAEKGCLRAPLLSNTETIKWRKVYVPIPIILNKRMVKGLSIPIVRNKSVL